MVSELTTGGKNRAQVLCAVAEDSDLVNNEYFGYLRRNPNELPDADHSGYEFWLNKLNEFNGDYIRADMVQAFITSGEYRRKFAP